MRTDSAAIRIFSPPAQPDYTAAVALAYLRRATILPAALVRPARFAGISQLLGAARPGTRSADVELLCDVCLALFAVDDLVDEGDLEEAEVALRMEQYAACAAGGYCPEVAFDPLALCLGSIAGRLRRAPSGSALWPEWTRRVRDFLQATHGAGRHSLGVALLTMAARMIKERP